MPADVSTPTSVVERVRIELAREPLEVITGEGFHDQDVYLDGREFHRCAFDRCRLFILIGNFRLVDQRRIVNCQITLGGPALALKELIDAVARQPPRT